ncbi:FHA domain-containing protein, partial [Streptomyces alkaliphilus]|uniref:FHA domain-containing protein n=1 Tax=Streptomyces alkaliphilus TaxID=1472722 RepID=UPI001E3167B4
PPPVPPPPVPGGEQRTGDWLLTPPGGPTPGTGPWMLDIAPDHDYFTAMMRRSGPEAARLRMPGPGGGQRILLEGPQMSIGRTRPSTGEAPDIDLSRPPEDPGVSHQHALLVRQPDHTWTIVDQGSTNGTTVNYEEEPIPPYVPVPLREGDRVHVGAWTTRPRREPAHGPTTTGARSGTRPGAGRRAPGPVLFRLKAGPSTTNHPAGHLERSTGTGPAGPPRITTEPSAGTGAPPGASGRGTAERGRRSDADVPERSPVHGR